MRPESSKTFVFCWYEKYSMCCPVKYMFYMVQLDVFNQTNWIFQQNKGVTEDSGHAFKNTVSAVKRPAGFFKVCLFAFICVSNVTINAKVSYFKNPTYLSGIKLELYLVKILFSESSSRQDPPLFSFFT